MSAKAALLRALELQNSVPEEFLSAWAHWKREGRSVSRMTSRDSSAHVASTLAHKIEGKTEGHQDLVERCSAPATVLHILLEKVTEIQHVTITVIGSTSMYRWHGGDFYSPRLCRSDKEKYDDEYELEIKGKKLVLKQGRSSIGM